MFFNTCENASRHGHNFRNQQPLLYHVIRTWKNNNLKPLFIGVMKYYTSTIHKLFVDINNNKKSPMKPILQTARNINFPLQIILVKHDEDMEHSLIFIKWYHITDQLLIITLQATVLNSCRCFTMTFVLMILTNKSRSDINFILYSLTLFHFFLS